MTIDVLMALLMMGIALAPLTESDSSIDARVFNPPGGTR